MAKNEKERKPEPQLEHTTDKHVEVETPRGKVNRMTWPGEKPAEKNPNSEG